MKRLPWITLLLALCAVGLHGNPWLTAQLQFDREAMGRGEVWRLFTAHLTHFGADHLWWDLAVFVVLGGWVEASARRRLTGLLLTAAPLITLGVWGLQPQFATYRGLSGIDTGLFGIVLANVLSTARREHDGWLWALGLAGLSGFLAKCGYELLTADTVFIAAAGEFTPVPLAHLIGFVCGLGVVFIETA